MAIEGWYQSGFNKVLARIQLQQGFGHIAEIGVHHGKSFVPLYAKCREGELALAVDCFADQQLNTTYSGAGDREIFLSNLPDTDHLRMLEGDTMKLTAKDYMGAVDGRFRLFHVDGGHDSATTLHDVTQAAGSLTDDGCLIVDDVFNPSWPGVSEGLFRFMNGRTKLKPFFIGYGKVVLAREPLEVCEPKTVKQWMGARVQIV